jgi:hypothetical protein
MEPSKIRRAFVIATIVVAVVIVSCFAIGFMSGAGDTGRSIGKLEGITDASGNQAGGGIPLAVGMRLRAIGAVLAGAWTLIALLVVLRKVHARWFLWPVALLIWWCAFEFLAAPCLAAPMHLWTYGIVTRVDHRPTNTDGEFNSDSLRGTPPSSAFVAGARNVIFLGDSFTFGSGVEPDQTFVKRFEVLWNEAHPDGAIHAANFGWVSSSPLLELRRLRDIGEKYHPKRVVWGFDMTDFSDDLRYRNMLEGRGMYALYDKLPITLKVFYDLFPNTFEHLVAWSVGNIPKERHFHALHPLDETRKWLEPTRGYLRDVDAWCRARGVTFVLVVLPRCYQYDARESPHSWSRREYDTMGPYALEPFRWFDEIRPEEAFPIVSLLPDFQAKTVFPTCFDTDPHWNSTGHDVAAHALVQKLDPYVPR